MLVVARRRDKHINHLHVAAAAADQADRRYLLGRPNDAARAKDVD